MEGSFGTQKEHYSLRRIKARKKETEILYIFFGIHTANVVQLAERLMEQQTRDGSRPAQIENIKRQSLHKY
jgi:hypothetical protein